MKKSPTPEERPQQPPKPLATPNTNREQAVKELIVRHLTTSIGGKALTAVEALDSLNYLVPLTYEQIQTILNDEEQNLN